ncbi:MAG: aminoacetone oxidase family FAD-binding enzyme [Bacilli bacterium]|nr:aminoacetone oxidase family FAD-binding enzyme [Bacilli bacterium]
MKKIVIVGGGASGLVTAIYAKNENNEVIVLEKNDICGKKILATGNGRCNYYNDNQDITNYYSKNIECLKEIITKDNLEKVNNLFTKLGIIPKIKNGYYYPLSNQASSIRNILENKVKELGIKIITNFNVEKIEKENNKFIISSLDKKIEADKVVIATGSFASIKNESEVIGYKILKEFNHKIEKVLPTLVQLKGNETYFKDWNGVRSDVTLKLFEDDNFIKEESGEIQLTDYGISGICTFNISGYVSRGLNNNKNEIVQIDFLPTIGNNRLELLNFLEERNNKLNSYNIVDLFEGILNNKLIKTILKVSNIDSGKTYDELTTEEKETLSSNIKEFKIKITGTNDFSKAQTCTGGLILDEINLNTMESKLVKDLYIVGELIDVDGVCGGYNLTFAWLSGILAGSDISD